MAHALLNDVLNDVDIRDYSKHPASGIAGEAILGVGLICLAVGAGLLQFVMIGLLGILLCGDALALLLVGAVLTRGASGSVTRSAIGLAVFVVGMVALVVTSGQATGIAYDQVRHAERSLQPGWMAGSPPQALWPWLVLWSPAASMVFALGLSLKSKWHFWKTAGWAISAIAVCPAAVAIFRFLAPILPLET